MAAPFYLGVDMSETHQRETTGDIKVARPGFAPSVEYFEVPSGEESVRQLLRWAESLDLDTRASVVGVIAAIDSMPLPSTVRGAAGLASSAYWYIDSVWRPGRAHLPETISPRAARPLRNACEALRREAATMHKILDKLEGQGYS